MPKVIKVRLILTEENKVLLLEQTNENGGKYTLPGGTVEALEFARKALIRECKEEIGIKLKPKDLDIIHILHKKKIDEDRLTFYFKTAKWEKTIKCKEKKKFATVSWFDITSPPPFFSFFTLFRITTSKLTERKSTLTDYFLPLAEKPYLRLIFKEYSR